MELLNQKTGKQLSKTSECSRGRSEVGGDRGSRKQ